MPATFRYVRTAIFTWARVTNDHGFERIVAVPTTVRVCFEGPAEAEEPERIQPDLGQAREIVDEWLDEYLAEKDAAVAVKFAPHGGLLADYLLDVFRQSSANVVEVSVTTGPDTWTARYEDETTRPKPRRKT